MPSEYLKENNFIMECLSRLFPDFQNSQDESDPNQLNWDYVITTAELNSVIPLIAKSINLHYKENIPVDVVETVSGINRETAVSNLIKLKEFSNINRQLNETGIKTVVLKGPGLGADIYGDISLRQFGDLDILINKDYLAKAVNVLQSNGYEYSFDYTNDQVEIYKKSPLYLTDQDMHYSFFNPVKKIYIELHWALMPQKYSFSQDVAEVFENKVSVSTGQGDIFIPGDEDMILFLSLHGSKHFWSRLIWIFDVAAFINKKKNLNWELVIAKSGELNCSRNLLLAISLAREIFGVEPPGVFHAYLKNDTKIPGLIKKVQKNFAAIYDLETIESGNKTFFLNSMESYADKFRFVADQIFKPTIHELELVNLPKRISFLYNLIRPFRLIKKNILKIFSHN